MSDDAAILEVFQQEAREILENIEADIVLLEEAYSPDTINSLFRGFHTLKGSSGIAGLPEVSSFTHHIETLLDSIRSSELELSAEIVDCILGSVDLVRLMIFSPGEIDDPVAATQRIVERLSGHGVPAAKATLQKSESAAKDHYFRIRASFRPDIFEFGIDPLMLIEELVTIGDLIEFRVIKNIPPLEEIDPERCYLSWFIIVHTNYPASKLDEIFLFVRDDNPIEIMDISEEYREDISQDLNSDVKIGNILVKKGFLSEDELALALEDKRENEKVGALLVRKKLVTEKDIQKALGMQEEVRKKIESTTIRIETGKLNNLMNLLGEIVIGQSSIARFADELDEDRGYALKNALHTLNRSTRQFQEQIMAMRMVTIGPTFSQFKRFVRDMARQIDKDIILEVRGKETELDKTVIEEITDPLKHMIRNSIDHGIESREDRLKKGKSAQGIVQLNAYHQEGSVFIEVTDDGRGLDTQKLYAKGIEKGILVKEREYTDDELYNLIFYPGFSTKEQVGDLSGRGVGMDVVKSNIDSLRGSVQIINEKDRSLTFRIKLPLTLAIIDGMMIRIGKSIYIIPLLSILESLRPRPEEVKTVKGQGEVVLVRGEYITLVRLYDYFTVAPQHTNPCEALVVIVESSGEKLALMIDDLIGQQQIVIKSLDRFITNKRSVSGAAILGDGNVALIIDIHGLLSEISVVRR